MTSLPIIDISAFVSGDEEAKKETASQLHKVCSEIGFFYLIGHGIPQDVINGAHEQAKKFFALDQGIKDEITIRNSPHFRGYQSLGENVTRKKRDWHEVCY
jgi:isopenicillin N synthase-like dioxygenase